MYVRAMIGSVWALLIVQVESESTKAQDLKASGAPQAAASKPSDAQVTPAQIRVQGLDNQAEPSRVTNLAGANAGAHAVWSADGKQLVVSLGRHDQVRQMLGSRHLARQRRWLGADGVADSHGRQRTGLVA